jgi:hypothetical protein
VHAARRALQRLIVLHPAIELLAIPGELRGSLFFFERHRITEAVELERRD